MLGKKPLRRQAKAMQAKPHKLSCPNCGYDKTVTQRDVIGSEHTIRSLSVKLQKNTLCPNCDRSLGMSEA